MPPDIYSIKIKFNDITKAFSIVIAEARKSAMISERKSPGLHHLRGPPSATTDHFSVRPRIATPERERERERRERDGSLAVGIARDGAVGRGGGLRRRSYGGRQRVPDLRAPLRYAPP
jgi:hypothetical protein